MLDAAYYADLGLSSISDKVLEGRRLEPEEGSACSVAPTSRPWARWPARRCRRHGHGPFMSLTARSTIPTSASTAACSAPSGATTPDDPGAFVLSHEDILTRLRAAEASALRLDELHIVGGCHPDLPLSWFEELLRRVRAAHPPFAYQGLHSGGN